MGKKRGGRDGEGGAPKRQANESDEAYAKRKRASELRNELVEARRDADADAGVRVFTELVDTLKPSLPPPDLAAIVLSMLCDPDITSKGELASPEKLKEATSRVYDVATSAPTPDAFKPNEAVFSTALRVFANVGDVGLVRKVLADMDRAGIARRHRTLSPVLKVMAQQVETLPDALAAYEEMSRAVNTPQAALEEGDIAVALSAGVRFGGANAAAAQLAARAANDLATVIDTIPQPSTTETAVAFLTSPAGGSFTATPHVAVNLDTGVCSACNQTLQSVEPTPEQLATILKETQALAPTQFESTKRQQWLAFEAWVADQIASKKFDSVVDGANVAYYRSSSGVIDASTGGARAMYFQTDAIFDELRRRGRRPVVFLHQRHFHQRGVSPELQQKWRREGGMYIVPSGHNDDVFWLYFTLQLGPGAILVSNDQMRDHRFEMLQSTKAFLKWRERHQCNFDLYETGRGSQNAHLAAHVYPPKLVSVQTQAPNAATGRTSWHFPARATPTPEEARAAEERKRLQSMNIAEAKDLLAQRKITHEQYRVSRLPVLGCDVPPTYYESYEWVCCAPTSSSASSSSSSSSAAGDGKATTTSS